MTDFLDEECFDFVNAADKAFIRAFDAEMNRLGYSFRGSIGSGYCWGRYMLIYTRGGEKARNVTARVYLAERGITLRLFLNGVDKHRAFIENAPAHIQEVFTGEYATCKRCHNDKDGVCKFRKSYTINGRLIEKCNGMTFEFHHPELRYLHDYLALYTEFYPVKNPIRQGSGDQSRRQ